MIFFCVLFYFGPLCDPSNYHEFCRLLARLKSNYQLGELVKVREVSGYCRRRLGVCIGFFAVFPSSMKMIINTLIVDYGYQFSLANLYEEKFH